MIHEPPAGILIVEDELIVAADIELRLKRLGYRVVGQAASAEEAIRLAEDLRPDIVLMDIRIQGASDGITAAEIIRQRFQLPVVYLTAHTDEATFQRAKVTEPFGYVLKPFAERELRTVIEMARYKFAAERKLAESEQRYATTLASIGDGVIATDAAGRVTYLNPQAEYLTGWPFSEAVGQSIGDVFQIVDENSRLPLDNPTDRVFETGESVSQRKEALMISREGGTHFIDYCTTPIIRSNGVTTGTVCVFRDTTNDRKREIEFREAQKMEAIGRLAGGVAHDFNNLLTIINNYCSVALATLTPNSELHVPIEEIAKAGERAEKLTRQLLAYGRRQMFHPEIVDLNQVVTGCESMLRHLLPGHIKLDFQLHPTPVTTRADPGQIEQVVVNLAINARDAIAGAGYVAIATSLGRNAPGELPHSPGGDFVSITFADNGCGMDSETRSRIWEPFFTTKASGKGTGLGLASVYGIVTQSGGHVSVVSELGRGSVFTVTLPACFEEAAAATHRRVDRENCRPTALVIGEDNDDSAETSRMLSDLGYRVLRSQCGLEALELAGNHPDTVNVLLTPWFMNSMSGSTLAKLLETSNPGIRTIFVLEKDVGPLPPVARSLAEKSVFLQKPFTREALETKLKESF